MHAAERIRRTLVFAGVGAGLSLAFFFAELASLVAAGFPLRVAEMSHPAVMHSGAVTIWQDYHMFFDHQGEWLPVLPLAACATCVD